MSIEFAAQQVVSLPTTYRACLAFDLSINQRHDRSGILPEAIASLSFAGFVRLMDRVTKFSLPFSRATNKLPKSCPLSMTIACLAAQDGSRALDQTLQAGWCTKPTSAS